MKDRPVTFDDIFEPDIEELEREADSPRKTYLIKHLKGLTEALNEMAASSCVKRPPSRPYLPKGHRLPKKEEYRRFSQMQADLKVLQENTWKPGEKPKKKMVQQYRDLRDKLYEEIESKNIYFIRESNRFTKNL